MLARRFGGSRTGAMLDPIADKSFMAVAFLTVARSGSLYPLEIAGVLARDIVAALGYVGAWLWRGPMGVPARAGGEAVTGLPTLPLVASVVYSAPARGDCGGRSPVGASTRLGLR